VQMKTYALAALLALPAAAGCYNRTLVKIDVTGDTAFDHVTLELVATQSAPGMQSDGADFDGASFSPSHVYKAGLYLPDGMTGPVLVTGKAIRSDHCEAGSGTVLFDDVKSGEATSTHALVIMAHASCIPLPDGGTGDGKPDSSGGDGSADHVVSGGTGGISGGSGGMIVSAGSGGLIVSTGSGGTPGSGGIFGGSGG